jgi:serine/threonine-protein kinase
MAFIPAGCFQMGDAFGEGPPNEVPVHEVCLSKPYYLDAREVTNKDYAACVDAKVCTPPGKPRSRTRDAYYGNPEYDTFPVIYVNWNQAKAYCAWASKRLPTEAEWERAARSGLSGKRYPWGDSISCTDAHYERQTPTSACGSQGPLDTQSVGSYHPNAFGVFDMTGNVFEWVNDGYAEYSERAVRDPVGGDQEYPVVRGGAWPGTPNYVRISYRSSHPTTLQDDLAGFRCAKD